MKWYSCLSLLLLEDHSKKDVRHGNLLDQLKDRIRDLYILLLRYMIETIRLHKQNFFSRTVKGFISDWKAKMTEIKDAEMEVKGSAAQCRGQQTNAILESMLKRQVDESQSNLHGKLYIRDMDDEMDSLQKRKDSLMPGSYEWIISDDRYRKFLDWNETNGCQVLWIKGEAGIGKTMLVIGLIRQLNEHFDLPCVCYFFCQGTDNKLNTATAVLKGLMWMLLRQEKSLVKYLEQEVRRKGDGFFFDSQAFPTLERIFIDMIQDETLTRVVLLVDALDECQTSDQGGGLEDLLVTIRKTVQLSKKVKWIVSGRPISTLNDNLTELDRPSRENTRSLIQMKSYEILEVNQKSTAKALKVYIDQKISDLGAKYRKTPDANAPRSRVKKLTEQRNALDGVADKIREKTDGTFLWAALLFREISDLEPTEMKARIVRMPGELGKIYDRIVERIRYGKHSKSYARVFVVVFNARRPLAVSELLMLSGVDEPHDEINYFENSGFLTIRDRVVYFIHQSAKDYFETSSNLAKQELFPQGFGPGHVQIVEESLNAMPEDLPNARADCKDLGRQISLIDRSELDSLEIIQYSCVYWIDHLCRAFEDNNFDCLEGKVEKFFQTNLLRWLEAVSLMKNLPFALRSIGELKELLQVSVRPTSERNTFATDFFRMLNHRHPFSLWSPIFIDLYI